MSLILDESRLGHRPNLEDAYRMACALDALGALSHPAVAALRDLVTGWQVESLGFRLTADSSASGLEVIDAGIRCCRLIRLPVRHPRDIERFVRACQAEDGGFARVPGALPEIESTHHATELLYRLEAMRAAPVRAGETTGVAHRGHA